MPLEPPPTTPSFLAAVSACTYSSGAMHDASGAQRFAHVSPLTGAWALAAAGDSMALGTFSLLYNATSDGAHGFVPAGSDKAYWLEEQSGAAVAVPK